MRIHWFSNDVYFRPVKAVRFSLDGLKLVSGSDDTTVRYWDMSTETCISIFEGHEVCVCVCVCTRLHPYILI